MPATPNAGADIVPVVQPFFVHAGEIEGPVLALQYTGNDMIYLVVNENEPSPPVWVDSKEIRQSYVK